MSLTGRCAIVTGASRNLGPAIVEALAREGARVAINHRDSPAEAAATAKTVPGGEGRHLVVQADVSDAAQVDRMVKTAMEHFGAIDILVNNAGPYGTTPLETATEEEWDLIVDSNLKGAWLCSRAVAPSMRKQGWGRIINISAVSARVRNRGAYGLAKAAVEVLTEQLACEFGPFATVNAVAPGQIDDSLDELASISPDWAAEVVRRTPRGRLVTRAEIADAIALLCTDPFQSLTGTTLHLDGGLGINRF